MTTLLKKVMEAPSIFKDKKVLERGFTPNTTAEIKHRDEVVVAYGNAMKDTLSGNIPDNLLIYGKTGTGKTMITNIVMNEVVEMADAKGVTVIPMFVPCEVINTNAAVLKKLLDQLVAHTGSGYNIKINSFSSFFSDFCNLLNTRVSSEQRPLVPIIVFDEIDKLKDPDLINSFLRMKENKMSVINICLIGTSNDLQFPEKLDYRTKSVFGHHEICTQPYDADQLRDILEMRAKAALIEGAADQEVIALCAATAAREHGNARKAINLLRYAAKFAQDRGSTTISVDDVKKADNFLESEAIRYVVESFPLHSKITLYAAILLIENNSKRVTTVQDICRIYAQICDHAHTLPLSNRRIYGLVDEMTTLGVLFTERKSRGRGKGIVKAVSLNTPKDRLIEFLYKDPNMQGIMPMELNKKTNKALSSYD